MVNGAKGVLILGGSDIRFNDCTFNGLDVALDVRDAKNVSVSRSEFINVRRAADVRRVEGFVAEDNRAFKFREPRMTTIARLVRLIVGGVHV